jgi:hypothetical protein
MHQKVVKGARKMRKIWEKSAKMRKMQKSAKCKCNAKMESKFASDYCNKIILHFRIFSHRTTNPAVWGRLAT